MITLAALIVLAIMIVRKLNISNWWMILIVPIVWLVGKILIGMLFPLLVIILAGFAIWCAYLYGDRQAP